MALDQDKTLQEVTEEILKNGLESRGYGSDTGIGGADRAGERGESDQERSGG
jgi:hypothetical protein